MLCLSRRRARNALALEIVLAFSLVLSPRELLAVPGEEKDVPGLCKQESLPEDIRGSLTRRFGDWKVQEPTDLSPAARDKWAAESPQSCPGIAIGRLQNDKDAAFAILLISTDRSDPEFALIVFTQSSGRGIYGYKLVERVETGASDTFVVSTPAAKYLQADSIWKSRSRPRDSLLLVNAAVKGQAYVYYWANDSYQRQQINY